MAGNEDKGSPTSEQDDYEDEHTITEHEETQENGEATLNNQDREPDSQTSDNEENQITTMEDVLTEAAMGGANDGVPYQETAQVPNINTAIPAQLESNTEVSQDVDPDVEEQLGDVEVGTIRYPNGVVYRLVMTIIAGPGASPEL